MTGFDFSGSAARGRVRKFSDAEVGYAGDLPGTPTNLRAEATRFIGRRRELDGLGRALADGAPLVTILGPSGIGKTRLGIRYGLTHLDRHPRGVWLCDLAETRTTQAIRDALEQAIPAADAGEGATRGRLLLILDNLEGAAQAAADCIRELLASQPDVQLLVTSRQRSAVEGERLFDLGGLEVAEGPAGEMSDAACLFCDRAEAVRGPVAISAEDRARVEEIVRQLDGIPLAIELAAARSRVLGLGQILEQVPRALDLFRRERPDNPRHATLRAAIGLSWQPLTSWEQCAMAHLSVFRGGFDLAAAEAVVDLASHPDAPPLIDVLENLCDGSLVLSSEVPTIAERRFRCYEVVREYASEALIEMGDQPAALARHCRLYASRSSRWVAELRGAAGAITRARMRLDRLNLLAAHAWALGQGETSPEQVNLALELLSAVEVAVLAQEPLEGFRPLLDRTIAAGRAAGAHPELLARALLMRQRASFAQAEVDARDAIVALELLGPDGAPALRGLCHYYGGYAWWYRGELDEARRDFERAARLMAAGAPPSHLWPHALKDLAYVLLELGQHDSARGHAEEALEIALRSRDAAAQWAALHALVALDRAEGHTALAHRRAERAVGLAAELGEAWREVASLHDLADLERDAGDLAAAERWNQAAGSKIDGFGWPLQRAYHTVYLGFQREEEGRPEEAVMLLSDACEAFRAAGFARYYAVLLAHLAVSLAGCDRIDEAGRALERARSGLDPKAPLDGSLLALADGHLELALARRTSREGDVARARHHHAVATEKVARLPGQLFGEGLGVVRVPGSTVCDVRLLARRFRALAGPRDEPAEIAEIVLDLHAHELRTATRVIPLRARAAVRKLLYALAGRPGDIVGKEELAGAVWSERRVPSSYDSALRANMHNLRRLLEGTGLEIDYLDGGYRLRAPPGFRVVSGPPRAINRTEPR